MRSTAQGASDYHDVHTPVSHNMLSGRLGGVCWYMMIFKSDAARAEYSDRQHTRGRYNNASKNLIHMRMQCLPKCTCIVVQRYTPQTGKVVYLLQVALGK